MEEIKLTVDYSKSVEQMIEAGNYDWSNRNIIAKNFPISPEMIGKRVEVSAKLFHFNRNISSKDVISEMDKAGYRPATLPEMLTLGEIYPELQMEFPIVVLGSVWRDGNGYSRVTVLDFDDYERKLDLSWFAIVWGDYCSFFGVRR